MKEETHARFIVSGSIMCSNKAVCVCVCVCVCVYVGERESSFFCTQLEAFGSRPDLIYNVVCRGEAAEADGGGVGSWPAHYSQTDEWCV
jgi:hypothetical protein